MNTPPANVSQRLSAARGLRKLSGREVDRRAGLALGTCCIIESRNQTSIRLKTAEAYARTLNVTVEWLMLGIGPSPLPETAAEPPSAQAVA